MVLYQRSEGWCKELVAVYITRGRSSLVSHTFPMLVINYSSIHWNRVCFSECLNSWVHIEASQWTGHRAGLLASVILNLNHKISGSLLTLVTSRDSQQQIRSALIKEKRKVCITVLVFQLAWGIYFKNNWFHPYCRISKVFPKE